MNCLGCRLANGEEEAQIIFENKNVSCFLDINPINEGHTLILPKAHVRELTEIDAELMGSIMDAASQISQALQRVYQPDGISMMQNGGMFNDLNHFHLHLFPRYRKDGFGWLEPTADKAVNTPISIRNKLAKAIDK